MLCLLFNLHVLPLLKWPICEVLQCSDGFSSFPIRLLLVCLANCWSAQKYLVSLFIHPNRVHVLSRKWSIAFEIIMKSIFSLYYYYYLLSSNFVGCCISGLRIWQEIDREISMFPRFFDYSGEFQGFRVFFSGNASDSLAWQTLAGLRSVSGSIEWGPLRRAERSHLLAASWRPFLPNPGASLSLAVCPTRPIQFIGALTLQPVSWHQHSAVGCMLPANQPFRHMAPAICQYRISTQCVLSTPFYHIWIIGDFISLGTLCPILLCVWWKAFPVPIFQPLSMNVIWNCSGSQLSLNLSTCQIKFHQWFWLVGHFAFLVLSF